MRKKLAASAAVLVLALTGCGAEATNEDGSPVPDSTSNHSKIVIDNSDDANVYEFTLGDGTHCVYVDGYKNGGVSCDWSGS